MSHRRSLWWNGTASRIALAVFLTTILACGRPLRDGPRLREVPEGFIYDANASQARSVTDLEQLEIDGRPAWGFSGTQWLDGKICAVSYRAIIPYESETFAVEFYSDMPQWLDAAMQREVVSEFEVPES